MSVYYKFNSELNFSHVGFDGLHISVADLKKSILHQKRLGKSTDFDLLISNAQTKEEYIEDDCLIPKNTSLIVARIPINSNQYNNSRKWEQPHQQQQQTASNNHVTAEYNSASSENIDLSKMNGSEEDKIQAMITQSTLDYDPTNYQRVRGLPQSGEVPQNYRCHRCHKTGHWIKNCPLNPPAKDSYHTKVRVESKKMTGIPRSLRDNAPNLNEPDNHQLVEQKKEIPEDLVCSICKSIFKDAVMIPCCGSSFCDECIRTALLESDENECPECLERGTSPGSLIPNRFLRNAVTAFHSDLNSLKSREKQIDTPKSHPEVTSTIDTPEKQSTTNLPVLNTETVVENKEMPDTTSADLQDLDSIQHSDEDDEDDNIIVTLPSASQQFERCEVHKDALNFTQISQKYDDSQESHSSVDDKDKTKDIAYGTYSKSSHEASTALSHSSNASFPTGNDDIEKTFPPSNNPQIGYQTHSNYNQQYFNPHASQHRPLFGPGQQYPSTSNQVYYPPHQHNMRPMRYDHMGNNYHVRHQHPQQHHHQMMHNTMNNNFGVRYQDHPPFNNLATMVTQNIQQRFGTGIIDDPLEAFNKIMREKEMRKDRFNKRSPMRFNAGRSRSPLRQYSPDFRRQKSPQRKRKRSRSFSSNSTKSSRSRSRSFDRHYTKENVHNRGYRRKRRSMERKRSSEVTRSKVRNKNFDDIKETNKSTTIEAATTHIDEKQEKSKIFNNETSKLSNEQPSFTEEPPPPGEELCDDKSLKSVQKENSQDENAVEEDKEKALSKNNAEKSSSDETKHRKKSREGKKHKKSSSDRAKKKKKRDRKEKKVSLSKSNTPELENKNCDSDAKVNASEAETKDEDNSQKSSHDNIETNEKYDEDIYKLEPSKWECDDVQLEKSNEQFSDHSIDNQESKEKSGEVTSEILKRAENAIFAKALNAIRPNIEVMKSENYSEHVKNENSQISSVIKKVDFEKKYESFKVTVPANDSGVRSIEYKATDADKGSRKDTVRTSIKDRLGKKIVEKSRSRSRDKKEKNEELEDDVQNSRKNHHLNSYINTVSKPTEDKMSRRHDLQDSKSIEKRGKDKKYQRSRSRSLKDADNRSDRNRYRVSSEKKSHYNYSADRNRDKSRTNVAARQRSNSPRSRHDKFETYKKSRSSSRESKKHKKKKKDKKEKKSKKKSRDRDRK